MLTPQRRGWPVWAFFPSSADKKKEGRTAGLIPPQFQSPAAGDDDAIRTKRIEAPPIASLDNNGDIVTTPQAEIRKRYRDFSISDNNSIQKKSPAALLMHISNMEAEKREETLKKALAVEKQCVTDLEKTLKEMRAEIAELKVMAENKCAQARDMVASTEERSVLAESKLHAAQALEAEAARKKANAERKLQEVEAREDALRRERQSYRAEKEACESELNHERQRLCDWEKKLQDGQERLLEGQSVLNQREEHAKLKEGLLQQLEKDLHDKQKDMEKKNIVLRQLESDLNARLAALVVREENEVKREISIDKKEQELLLLQEKLASRERKENELDEKAKIATERAHFLESKEKQLEAERKVVAEERKSLMILKTEIEILSKQIEEDKKRVLEEKEKLRITEQEREDLLNMQRCLKEEIDDCRAGTKLVSIHAEELKKERELFEREWDILDEKREQIRNELDQAEKEKRRVAKWLQDEEARVKQEKHSLHDQICRDTEALRLEKEVLVSTMEHERREWFAKVEKEREDLVRDMDVRKRDFEKSIDKRKDDLEKQIKQRELRFKKEAEIERHNLAALKALAEKDLEDVCHEKQKLDKERQEIAKYREDSEKDWIGIREDIEELRIQREKLKEQREALKRERLEISQSAEKLNKDKGLIILDDGIKNERVSKRNNIEVGSPEMGLLNVHISNGVVPERSHTSHPPEIRESPSESSPGKVLGTPGRFSWLQRCASVLFPTPDRKQETANIEMHTESQLESAAVDTSVDAEYQITVSRLDKSNQYDFILKAENGLSGLDEINRHNDSLENEEGPSRSSQSFTPDQLEEIDDSQLIGPREKKTCIKHTHSICTVVEDAMTIADSSPALKADKEGFLSEGDVGNFYVDESTNDGDKTLDLHVSINVEHDMDSKLAKQTRERHCQQQSKERSTEQEVEAETESEFAITGKRKRRQRESGKNIEGEEGKRTPGWKHYNLRRSTIAFKAANQQVPACQKEMAEHRRRKVANDLWDANNRCSVLALETEPQGKEPGLNANELLEEQNRWKERQDFIDALVSKFAFSCEHVSHATHGSKTVDKDQDVQEDNKEEDIHGAVF